MKVFLRFVQKALDDTRWEIDRNEFDELMATKKRICSRSRWDSILSLQVCWRIGLSIPVQSVIEGGPVPMQFAASRTVFIPSPPMSTTMAAL